MSSRQIAPNMASLVVTHALNTINKNHSTIRFCFIGRSSRLPYRILASFPKPNASQSIKQETIRSKNYKLNPLDLLNLSKKIDLIKHQQGSYNHK